MSLEVELQVTERRLLDYLEAANALQKAINAFNRLDQPLMSKNTEAVRKRVLECAVRCHYNRVGLKRALGKNQGRV